ncbi:mucin-2 isoform X2 [Phyllopteryx taeniolatus]|uniref:mucin-2 isoform X2 n=1 Tax=Phyllopteryx taeniolatus TaxID=161469 RepID=UPI002AD2465E|nr:mucin-2 isoform X2 [Phyllopteryx taeniolatus]
MRLPLRAVYVAVRGHGMEPFSADSEPTVVSSDILYAVAGLPPTSACENGTEDPTTHQCSTEELRKSHYTQVTTVYPTLEENHNLHEAQNLSIEPVNHLSPLTAVGDNMQMAFEQPSRGHEQAEKAEEQNVEPTLRNIQQGEQIKCGLMEDKTKCETEGQINKNRKQRKQPSQKVKRLQKTPKETRLLPSTDADGALHDEVKNPPPSQNASLPQALSHPPGICSSSVMLQDALLLVEAMDQSKSESSPQEKATAQDQCTLSVATLPPVVESPLLTPALPSQSPPTASISDKGTEEVSTNQALFVTYTTNSSNSHSHLSVPTVHQQKHCVGSSGITSTSLLTATAGKSLEQCAPHPPSVLAEPLETMMGPDPAPKKIFVFSKSPSTHPQETIAPLSPNQISAVVSTVAAQSKNDVTSTTAAPRVMSDTTISSTEQRAHPTPCKKIKIIIHRATGLVASQPQMSETLVAPINQNSVEPAVTMSPSQHPNTGAQVTSDKKETPLPTEQITPLSSSQHPNTGAPMTSDEKETPLPNEQISPLSYPQLECSSQQTSICESLKVTPGEQAGALSTESVPINRFPLVPVIRLKRLPYPALSTGSFLVSQLSSHERESEVVPPDSTSSLTNDQASEPTVSPAEVPPLLTRKCSNSKETLNPSSKSEKASPCSTLEEAPATGLSPSVSEPILAKTTIEFDKAELSGVSDQECETCTLDEEIIDGAEQGYSATAVQLTPITKDLPEPHLQSSKTQFIAQLAISPVIQEAEKVLANESPDAQSSCEGTNTDGRRKLQKKSVFARLGIHLKKHSRAKRAKTKAEPLTDKACIPESPKKPRLENVSTTEQDSTLESSPVSTNIASPLSPTGQLTEIDFLQVSLRNQQSTDISYTERTGTCEPVSVSSRKPVVSLCRLSLKDTRDSTSIIAPLPHTEINVAHGSSTKNALESGSRTMRDPIERLPINSETPSTAEECANKPFESTVSPKSSSTMRTTDMAETKLAQLSRSTSNQCTDNASSEKSRDSNLSPGSGLTKGKPCVTQTTLPAVIAGKPSTNRDENSPNMLKVIPAYLRSNTTKDTNTPPKPKFQPESRKRCLSPKENASVKKSLRDQSAQKKTSVSPSPPRTKLASPKKSPLPAVGQNGSSSMKNAHSQSLRSGNFCKEEKSAKGESNSSLGKTAFASALLPKWATNDASSSKTGESSPKNSRFSRKCTVQKINVKRQIANTLSTAAILNAVPKNKQPKLKTTKQVINSHSRGETGTKYISPRRVRARAAPQVRPAAAVGSPQSRLVIGKRLLKNQCKECGRVLSSSSALESHVSLHTGHRPYCCTLCRKSFPDAKGLNRHGRVHHKGRNHICQKCGKGFVYGFGLTKHLQMVHGKIKPFVCQICNKAFFTKRDVETHIRSHTGERPFHCHLCEKKFARSVELNAHLRWHRGEKRHWCPYCGKGFFDQNNLKRHKYIHTGEKPHSCPHCPKHFTQSGHLKKHVKNVHKVQ